jgi:hypothetical protein
MVIADQKEALEKYGDQIDEAMEKTRMAQEAWLKSIDRIVEI